MNKTPYHKRPNLNNYYKKGGYYNNYKNNSSNLGYYENNKKYYYNNFDTYDNYEQYGNYPYNDNTNFKKNNYYGNPMFNSINNAYEQIDDDEIFSYGIAQPNKLMQNNFEVKEKKEEILRIKINIKGDIKELIIYKDDKDINAIINKFCDENNINTKLKKPILDKVINSIETTENFINKLVLDKEDYEIINKLNKIYNNNS